VHHDARIRQREAHVLVAGGQQQRAHRRRLTRAKRRHRRTDELHGVVDRKTDVTTPPGELMYIEISFFGFSASRNRSCATTKVDMPSSTGPVKKMMRSFSRREKMS